MSSIPDNNPLDGEAIGSDEPPSLLVETNLDPGLPLPVPVDTLHAAARAAAAHRGFTSGEIGIRVTDDPTIRQINRQHLEHDEATDVISFGYAAEPPRIEGELVVSVDTAAARAVEIGWPVAHELMLYVVHGTLHLGGMDDASFQDRNAMRHAERAVMTRLGIGSDEMRRYGADADATNPVRQESQL